MNIRGQLLAQYNASDEIKISNQSLTIKTKILNSSSDTGSLFERPLEAHGSLLRKIFLNRVKTYN